MDRAVLDLAVQAAWPPRATAAIGPWMARLDGGVTRRPNSVLPHGDGPEPDDATLNGWLAAAVELYHGRGLDPWIQVSEAAWPPRLEERLAEHGWETGVDRTLLLAGPARMDAVPGVVLASAPPEEWVRAWWAVDPRGGEAELAVCRALLARIEGAAFATAVEGCHTLGVGLGVVVGELLVLECVATVPSARRRGVGSRVVQALGAWGAERGAGDVVLAVQERNLAARGLYQALGLTQVSSYAYARPGAGATHTPG